MFQSRSNLLRLLYVQTEIFNKRAVCRQKDFWKLKLKFHALLGVEGVRLLWAQREPHGKRTPEAESNISIQRN